MTWRDLSDDELRARLVQRRDSGRRPVPDLDVIDLLVRERDTADVAPLIDELLE